MNFLPAPIRKGIKALLKPILRPLVLRLDMPFRVMLPKIRSRSSVRLRNSTLPML